MDYHGWDSGSTGKFEIIIPEDTETWEMTVNFDQPIDIKIFYRKDYSVPGQTEVLWKARNTRKIGQFKQNKKQNNSIGNIDVVSGNNKRKGVKTKTPSIGNICILISIHNNLIP